MKCTSWEIHTQSVVIVSYGLGSRHLWLYLWLIAIALHICSHFLVMLGQVGIATAWRCCDLGNYVCGICLVCVELVRFWLRACWPCSPWKGVECTFSDASCEFSFTATMTKIIKEMLPPDVRVARDAQDLLIECCVGEI